MGFYDDTGFLDRFNAYLCERVGKEVPGSEEDQLQQMTQHVEQLEQELKTMKALEDDAKFGGIRRSVAEKKKVPVEVLTGTTMEECALQADAFIEYTGQNKFPQVIDGGEVGHLSTMTTFEKFEEWFGQIPACDFRIGADGWRRLF